MDGGNRDTHTRLSLADINFWFSMMFSDVKLFFLEEENINIFKISQTERFPLSICPVAGSSSASLSTILLTEQI